MLSNCLIWMRRHARYWGSHVPSVSEIESLCSASSWSSMTDVNALVLLPLCHSAPGESRGPPPYRVVPTARAMGGLVPGYVTLSDTAEMCAGTRRVLRYLFSAALSEFVKPARAAG